MAIIVDETADQRKGMGYEGVANLKRFIERGGVFITEGASTRFPIDFALTRRVSIREPQGLQVRGSVLRTRITDAQSPITYGYDDAGRQIIEAIEKGSYKVRIGSDAKLLDRMSRLLPQRSTGIIADQMKKAMG